MADTVVLRLFLEKTYTILENETSLIGNVRGELEETRNELQSMRGFLEDAEQMTGLRENEKLRVENVKDMVYDIEDLIDKFFYHVSKPPAGGEGTLTRFIYRTIRLPKTLLVKDHTARKLQKYNQIIKKAIPERMNRYHLEGTAANLDTNRHRMMLNLQEGAIYTKEDDHIGIDDSKEKLISLLTMETYPQRIVISVIGMGGVGKTTVAATVYKSLQVTKSFTCYALVNVSQNYSIDDLLRKMVKELFKGPKEFKQAELKDMSYRDLVEKLVNLLEHKKYIVVLDDVWDVHLWDHLKVALPDGIYGSRVLLTTRHEFIANADYGVGSQVHHIEPLQNDEARSLFCKKAFPRTEGNKCPQELESVVSEFVRTCKGLPLAILALGGVMASKTTREWRQVSNNMKWHLKNNLQLEPAKRILWLSYNDLPHRLKPCFLYFCLFPNGYPIRRREIVRLWIAEGFIEEDPNLTPEEVGEGYITELISRSMIQVLRRLTSGMPEVFKVHDFLRETALSMKETNKFCFVHDVGGNNLEECKARRLSVQSRYEEMNSSIKGISKLRSFFVFSKFSLNSLFDEFRMLRVLDLKDGDIDELPEGVGELFNLRYLNLKRTNIKELPEAIGKLRNLQTLDIRDTPIVSLPAGISKMQNLRHLIMYGYKYQYLREFEYVYGKLAPSNISKLVNLQALMGIKAEGNILTQIGCLTQLKRIAITKLRQEDEGDMCNSIQNMTQLRFLFVMTKNEKQLLRMDALLTPPPNLYTLNLVGKMDKIPNWFTALENLVALYLHWSGMDIDPLPSIQDLPNLGRLMLVKAYNGRHLKFSKGFKKLIILHMELDELVEIVIEQGVMADLEQLNVTNCPELKLPIVGIEHLAKLRVSHVIPNHTLSKFQGGTFGSTSYAT